MSFDNIQPPVTVLDRAAENIAQGKTGLRLRFGSLTEARKYRFRLYNARKMHQRRMQGIVSPLDNLSLSITRDPLSPVFLLDITSLPELSMEDLP